MKKYLYSLLIILSFGLTAFAQMNRPKLVVGIVVDQMRPDYITRYYDQFGDGGFKLLLSGGYAMWNVHYNYVPTVTAAGHASIYSGTTPRYHGILENSIYYRDKRKMEYCVSDTFDVLGNDKPVVGKGESPRRMIATNICDELKLCTGKQSKIISISLKDRAAVLPAGHLADDVFWFDSRTGNFVTSTFYAKFLPDWLLRFNKQNLAANYIKNDWKPLYADEKYTNCILDTSVYAVTRNGNKILPIFPHSLKPSENPKEAKYSPLFNSPFANSLLTDLAIDAIKNGGLCKGTTPDLLAISYSSTDAVGHIYGPQSKEIEDTYLRLDKDLERLLKTLNETVGQDNYVLFLTADHAAPEIPQLMMNQKMPAGYIYHKSLYASATEYLNNELSAGKWIDTLVNDQFYLNRKLISEKKLNLKSVQTTLAEFLLQQKGVAFAYTASELNDGEFTTGIGMRVQNGFQPKHSGDIMLVYEPGFFEYVDGVVLEHGSAYSYDTNVPLIWYGQNIKKGESWQLHYITDIAPTLSMILRIKYPSACIGNPILEIRESK